MAAAGVEVGVLLLSVARKNGAARKMVGGSQCEYQDNLWSSWIVGKEGARS
jgi:hypothetical protein